MKQRRKIGEKVLSFGLALMMAITMIPAMALTSYAAAYDGQVDIASLQKGDTLKAGSSVGDTMSEQPFWLSVDGMSIHTGGQKQTKTVAGEYAAYGNNYAIIKLDLSADYTVTKNEFNTTGKLYDLHIEKITPKNVTGVTLNHDTISVVKGEDYSDLVATVAPADATNKTVAWKSSDENVAAVDDNGKVTGVKAGTATITATATNGTDATTDDKTASCTVTVTEKIFNITNTPAENGKVEVKLGDAEATSAKEGETVTLIATPDEGYVLKELAIARGTERVNTSTVTEGEKYTFTMPAGDVSIAAVFKKAPVTVLVDVGAGHEKLFTEEVLNNIKVEYELASVTIEGSILKLEGVSGESSENDVNNNIWDFIDGLTDSNYRHNGEELDDVGYRPIDEYATRVDAEKDIYNASREETAVSDYLKYYVLWLKPVEKLEIDNGNPACGKKMQEAFPTVPDGFKLDQEESVWIDENGKEVETFEAGKEYTFKGSIKMDYYGSLWKKYIDPDNFTLTVEGGEDVTYEVKGRRIYMTFNATADHDWTSWYTTKDPTEWEEGEEERYCIHCETKATRPVDVLYSVGLELDTFSVELSAEEGYKGATDEGLDEDAVQQTVKATSLGNDVITFILAGFKDASDYEKFTVIVGGMEATVAPKEGLKPGTYTTTLVISDFEDRIEPLEVPVTFTVTAKKTTYKIAEGDGQSWTKGSNRNARFVFKRSTNDELTFGAFKGILVDGKKVAKDKYKATKGSVIIDVKPAFLNTLSVGTHTLTAQFDDADDVTVKFTVAEKAAANTAARPSRTTSVKTADESPIMRFSVLFAAAFMAAILLSAYRKKRG